MALRPLSSVLFSRLARSRACARALFGIRCPRLRVDEHCFDVTTLALRRAARTHIAAGARVLDVGAGSFAVLGLWLWRRGARVTCIESDAAIAARARETIELNGAGIELRCERFLGSAPAEHDFVLFNPPYIARSVGERRGLPASHRSQWDGGPDGTDVLRGFLADFEARGGSATALLGVNGRHVAGERVAHLIAERTRLELAQTCRGRWLPSTVYVLVRKKSPIAKASSPVE